MQRTRIKICGLKTAQDVVACREAGADAVGFVFYSPSPRAVAPELAAKLCLQLGPWQTPVALFVNPEPDEVRQVVASIPQVLLQFHGDESPEFCASFGRPYLKAIRMKADTVLVDEAARYCNAQALLLDSWSAQYGGSGHTFDWSLMPKAGQVAQPLVLSGGLNSDNVAQAVTQESVYGVDVSSGVESSRGVKNPALIFEFCKAVQLADSQKLK